MRLLLLVAGCVAATLATAAAQAPTGTGLAVPSAGAFAKLPPGHADDGEGIFKKCAACHQIGPTAKNNVGPELNGVVGRKSGMVPGYAYSNANKNSGITWTPDELAAYLPAPQMALPGTKMTFPGLTDPQDVADVIAYLKTFDASGNKVAAPAG